MFDDNVSSPEQLPIDEKNRKSTDVCCTFIGAIFALVVFIVACCAWNRTKFGENYFGFAKTGTTATCKDTQYLHSTDANSFQNSKCVSACPATFASSTQKICLPLDDKLREAYLANPKISSLYDFDNFYSVLLWSFIYAVGLGLLWLSVNLLFPKISALIAHFFGAVALITLGILVLVLDDKFWSNNAGLKIFFAIMCFVLAIILIVMLFWYANQRKFQGFMLFSAKRFLIEKPETLIFIPIFMAFSFGLRLLFYWQHSCFGGSYGNGNNFFDFSAGGFWSIVNIIWFLWGFRFLRDAFNFCVSGCSTDWYWNRPYNATNCTIFSRLMCKHWGSVVGGSFLNAFLTVPTLLVELVVCHPEACCPSAGRTCKHSCNWFTSLFELVRSDAYSYIHLSGIPFCNSAREVKKINERSPLFVGSFSPMFHFRFAATVFLVTLLIIGSWFILRARVWSPNLWHWITFITLGYITLSWFINITADVAEGIQTSYFVERELEGGKYKFMHKLLPSLRSPLEHLESRKHGEGDGFC